MMKRLFKGGTVVSGEGLKKIDLLVKGEKILAAGKNLEFQDAEGNVVLEGTDIKTASAKTSQDNMGNKQYIVELNLTDEGKTKFAEATEANIGNRLLLSTMMKISESKSKRSDYRWTGLYDGMES